MLQDSMAALKKSFVISLIQDDRRPVPKGAEAGQAALFNNVSHETLRNHCIFRKAQ